MFASEKNKLFIAKTIFYKGQEIGKTLDFNKLLQLVNLLQKKYIQTRITETTDLNLDDLNYKFINYCLSTFDWRIVDSGISLAGNNTQSYESLYASDIPSINIWEIEDSINIPVRYEKRNPTWRTSQVVRNYDRSNEGLKNKSRSLESPLYNNNYEPLNIL